MPDCGSFREALGEHIFASSRRACAALISEKV